MKDYMFNVKRTKTTRHCPCNFRWLVEKPVHKRECPDKTQRWSFGLYAIAELHVIGQRHYAKSALSLSTRFLGCASICSLFSIMGSLGQVVMFYT